MLRNRSYAIQLFLAFSLLAILVILVLSTIFFQYTSSLLIRKSVDASEELTGYIVSKTDSFVKELDRISSEILFNPEIQEAMQSAYLDARPDASTEKAQFERVRNIESAIYSLGSAWYTSTQINLFNDKNLFVSAGLKRVDPQAAIARAGEVGWLREAADREGAVYIVPPREEEWSAGREKETVISVARSFQMGQTSLGIIEIQKSYAGFAQLFNDERVAGGERNQIVIYSRTGELIYPEAGEDGKRFGRYRQHVVDDGSRAGTLFIENESSRKEWLSHRVSDYTGWTVIVVNPEETWLKPVDALIRITIAIAVGLLFAALLFAFYVSRTLTAPVRLLQRQVRKLNLHDFPVAYKANRHKLPPEIASLDTAISAMVDRLNDSVGEMIEAQSRENQSHLQALQAQMQPHFMFNTLTAIGMEIEQNPHRQAAEMCYKLADMLRYTTQSATSLVSVATDWRHTENYLTLIGYRFPDRFYYHADIAEQMADIRIPRLIFQPIVENAVQHAYQEKRPPWHLYVQASGGRERAVLRVWDNGKGFPADVLRQLQLELAGLEGRDWRAAAAQPIGGMGLMNTFARLKILYKDRLRVAIGNDAATGGAYIEVTIDSPND